MAKRTNPVAWGLMVVLAVVLVGGLGMMLCLRIFLNRRQAALVEAARQGNTARVAELLDVGAHVDPPGSVQTVLDGAINARQVDLVKLLLEHGASATTPIFELEGLGLTPLDRAADEDSAELIKLLLAHGANANQRDPQTGQTLLMSAARDGRLAAVQALLAGGANPNAQNRHRLTALHQAAFQGQTKVVRALIDNGTNVNARDGTGWTPLMAAVGGARPETVKLLLALGADVNAEMHEKGRANTALTIARRHQEFARQYPNTSRTFGHQNVHNYLLIIKILKRAGAKELNVLPTQALPTIGKSTARAS